MRWNNLRWKRSGQHRGVRFAGRVTPGLAGAWFLLLQACAGSREVPVVPGPETAPAEKGTGAPAPEQEVSSVTPGMNAKAAQAYSAGIQAFQSGDLAGARTQFEQAISADAKAYQAHFALGTVLERGGSPDQALGAYRRAVDIKPGFGPAVEAITRVYLRDGRTQDAESFLNQQRTAVPSNAAVLAALAEVKSVQKDSAEAQRLAQESLKADPDYRPAMVVLARDHYRNRRLDLAQYTLTAILDGYGPENPPRDETNPEARLIRALIYKEQGSRKAAIDELERVVELRPDMVEARLNLAVYMLEAGNAKEATPLLEGALAYEPSNHLVHLNLGDAYRLQGRPNEALKQLEWVTKADPNLPQTHYNIGLVYLFSPQVEGVSPEQAIDKAIAAFERYKKLQPRTRQGAGDDVDELLSRARNKKAVLEAMKAQPMDDFGDEGAGDEQFDDFE